MAHLKKGVDKRNDVKGRDKTAGIVGTPLYVQKWGLGFQEYQ